MPQAIPFLTLAVAVGGTAASISQARTAENKREKAQKLGQRQAAIENQRRIRQAVAASRADRANLIAGGFGATGGFDSSSLAGGVGAVETQTASNIGFARQNQAFNTSINRQQQAANRANTNAATFGQIANLPTQFGRDFGTDAASVRDSIKNQFGKNAKPIKPTGSV